MAIVIVINLVLAAYVTTRLLRLVGLVKPPKTVLSYLLVAVVMASGVTVGFVAPVVTYGMLEQTNIVEWNGSDRTLFNMLGLGFLCSVWGTYLGYQRVQAEAQKLATDTLGQRFRNLKKSDRQCVFGSIVWVFGVLLYTIGFDPFNNGSWEYMDGEEYSTLIFTMVVPPIFAWAAKIFYEKFVS